MACYVFCNTQTMNGHLGKVAELVAPGRQKATVHRSKIVDYLLSESHPDGLSKARFFIKLGFDRNRPWELELALVSLAREADSKSAILTKYGTKFVIDGFLSAVASESRVRTIWIVERGSDQPVLVTAYPARRGAS